MSIGLLIVLLIEHLVQLRLKKIKIQDNTV